MLEIHLQKYVTTSSSTSQSQPLRANAKLHHYFLSILEIPVYLGLQISEKEKSKSLKFNKLESLKRGYNKLEQ